MQAGTPSRYQSLGFDQLDGHYCTWVVASCPASVAGGTPASREGVEVSGRWGIIGFVWDNDEGKNMKEGLEEACNSCWRV